MSDTIGRITVPTVINSGQTFPLTTQSVRLFRRAPALRYRGDALHTTSATDAGQIAFTFRKKPAMTASPRAAR